jgi:hypothetical protein
MNQSLDLVSLVGGVIFVAMGLWVAGDAVSARPPLAVLLPAVGALAVVAVLVTSGRGSRSRS